MQCCNDFWSRLLRAPSAVYVAVAVVAELSARAMATSTDVRVEIPDGVVQNVQRQGGTAAAVASNGAMSEGLEGQGTPVVFQVRSITLCLDSQAYLHAQWLRFQHVSTY